MKEIKLTRGMVALIDDEDVDKVKPFKWRAHNSRGIFYATSDSNGMKNTHMHRIIINAPQGVKVDHINGNGLDNRKANLRLVTHRQNCQNKHVPKTSIFPGVSWQKSRKRWQVRIRIEGKLKFIGRFRDEVEAFDAYCAALKKIGESLVNDL